MQSNITMRVGIVALWSRLKMKKYYGLWLLVLAECIWVFVLLLWSDELYIVPNDCLDSNVSLYKMFKDIGAWTDRK